MILLRIANELNKCLIKNWWLGFWKLLKFRNCKFNQNIFTISMTITLIYTIINRYYPSF